MIFTFTDSDGMDVSIPVHQIESITGLKDRGYGDPQALITAQSGKLYYAKESHRELYVRLENTLGTE